MARCPVPQCGGYVIYEPGTWWNTSAAEVDRLRVDALRSRFQERTAELFSNRASGQRIGWQMEHPGYDLLPSSAAAQLGISLSFFRESVKKDRKAPVILGRGMIACNTPALQEWWEGKRHHK
jgi:hypothetical protein